ncbi:hypothetical protein ACHAPT_000226 [Fusarium lateritium]
MDQKTRRLKSSKAGDKIFKTKSYKIPNLTELRKSLGYGHRGREQDIALKRAITEQVETFVSTDNLCGVECSQWKTPIHQKGLREMTKDFLNVKARGAEFWPDNPNSSNKRPLEYTRDYEQIQRILTKVFYRTVQEHKRKQSTTSTANESTQALKDKYTRQPRSNKKSRSQQSSRQVNRDSRGESADDPIELDNMQSTTNTSVPSTDIDPFAGSTLAFTFRQCMPFEGMPDGITTPDEPTTDRVWEIRDDYLEFSVPGRDNPASNVTAQTTAKPAEDPYQVPNSPTEDTQVPQNRGKRPERPYSIQDVRPAKVPRQEQGNRGAAAGPSTSDPSPSSSSANMASASASSADVPCTNGSSITASSNGSASASGSSTNVPGTSNPSSNSTTTTSVPSQGDPSADLPPTRPVKKRSYTRHEYIRTRASTRHREPVQRPGFAREQTVDIAILASSSSSEDGGDDNRERETREPARPTTSAPKNTSRREDPSGTTPRHDAAAPAAEQSSSQARQTGSNKQTSAKNTSMPPPRAPVPQPGSTTRPGPVQESPAGPSTKRMSAQRPTNSKSASKRGTRQPKASQPKASRSQTSQPQVNQSRVNQPRAEQNWAEHQQSQAPRINIVRSAEERQIIVASSFIFFRHDGTEFQPWTPSTSVFRMTLSELMQELDWARNNAQILYMRLETPEDTWTQHIGPGNDDKFNSVMRSFAKKMRRSYQRARMTSAATPDLEFELHFWQQRESN